MTVIIASSGRVGEISLAKQTSRQLIINNMETITTHLVSFFSRNNAYNLQRTIRDSYPVLITICKDGQLYIFPSNSFPKRIRIDNKILIALHMPLVLFIHLFTHEIISHLSYVLNRCLSTLHSYVSFQKSEELSVYSTSPLEHHLQLQKGSSSFCH